MLAGVMSMPSSRPVESRTGSSRCRVGRPGPLFLSSLMFAPPLLVRAEKLLAEARETGPASADEAEAAQELGGSGAE